MSYQVSASTPTQCVKQTIAWSGPAGPKRLETWVEGTNYFAETIAANVTGTLGTVDWVCDIPAGASIAFEIYALPGGKPYGTTRFFDVQPGTTDACLRQNPGQLRPSSMAALASSLSSASPELFTGYSTTSMPTTTSSSASTTASAATTSSASPSATSGGSSVQKSALIGGIVGGVAGVVFAALALWGILRSRRRRASQLGATSAGASATAFSDKDAPVVTPSGGNPVNAWLGRVQPGARPPSTWTGRSRTQSVRNALSGFTNRSSGAPGTPSVPRAQGPRADLPEVGEAGDFGAYARPGGGTPSAMRWQPTSYTSVPAHDSSGYAGHEANLPLPSSLQPRGIGNAALPEQEQSVAVGRSNNYSTPMHSMQASPPRPPTRLTTPGGFSDAAQIEAMEAIPPSGPYASRPRN